MCIHHLSAAPLVECPKRDICLVSIKMPLLEKDHM